MAMTWVLMTMLAAASPGDGPMSSGRLAELCSNASPVQSVLCGTYLKGAVEGLVSAEASLGGGDTDFCLPTDGTTTGAVRDGFLRFMVGAPELGETPAGETLLMSLGDLYPCADWDEADGPLQVIAASAKARHGHAAHRRHRVGPEGAA